MPKSKRVLVAAVLAATSVLLTACDLGASAADSDQQQTSTTAPEGESAEDVPIGYSRTAPEAPCGESTTEDGRTLRLISDEGSLGFISCDDAADVFGDFAMLDDQVEIPAEGLNFNDDWHCDTTVDGGVTVGVACYTPMYPDPANPILLRFHTELT
jgi:hypothetical protein